MDIPDTGEAPPPAAETSFIDDQEHSVATNDDRGPIHPHFSVPTRPITTLSDVVDTFISNTKLRFGDNSSEVTAIFSVLTAFQAGKVSKRDTFAAIQVVLGDQTDLKQGLMNILLHKDADWGMGDFDFASTNPLSPSPRFLQPIYQPQMHLPSISPPWFRDNQAYLSSVPSGTGGYVGSFGYGQSASPSTAQISDYFRTPNAFTPPHMAEPLSYAHHMRENYEADTSPRVQHFDQVPQLNYAQHGWERTEHQSTSYYDQPWSTEGFMPTPGRAESFASHQLDPSALSYERRTHEAASPARTESVTASPSILGVPISVPVGQLVDDLNEPSRKRRRQNSTAHIQPRIDTHQEDVGTSNNEPVHVVNNTQSFVTAQPRTEHHQNQTREGAGSGPYIHSLCGKGFSARSKVKKHHWGVRMDDPETTTGCWAKHKKPNVSWNEHPSCQEAPSAAKRQRSSKQKAPSFSSLAPTPPDPPQTFTTPQDLYGGAVVFGDPGPHHPYQLPVRTSFDNLLTAVNVAAQIDAPRPQGRIDSVISHLDAQAAATERNRHAITNWQDTSGSTQNDSAYGYYPPYTVQGLGISPSLGAMHVPMNVAVPVQQEAHAVTSSSGSATGGDWNHDGIRIVDDIHGSSATLQQPSSPKLETKNRQV